MDFIARVRSKLTYPNIGVTVCLFVLIALLGAGQAYAINTIRGEDVVDGSLSGADIGDRTLGVDDLDTDSVGFRALQFGSVTNQHLRDGTITGSKVADRSLTAADVQYGYQVVKRGPFRFGPGQEYFVFAECPQGSRAVGGGGTGGLTVADLTASYPAEDGRSWFVHFRNASNASADWYVYAICLRVG